MDNVEEKIERIEQELVPVMAKRFWPLYLAVLLLALIASYHNIFTILPHPVTASGITKELRETYQVRYHGRSGAFTERLFARKIKFDWQGKSYEVTGGWDEEMGMELPVKVVFNANHPEKAYELSVIGLLDFRVLRWAVPAWILISGFLYAFSFSDPHFTAFNFKVHRLKWHSFTFMLVIVLLIPLYPSTDLLLFGKKTDGIMAEESDYVNGHYLRAVVFKAAGVHYSAYSQYANDYEKKSGKHFSVLYWPYNPNRCCVYQFGPLYQNNYFILMGISLIFLTGWFYGSRL